MPATFPCAICGTLLNSTNTFSYQKHMTRCHWPGNNNVFPLSSIFTFSSTPMPSPIISDSACSAYSVLGKRKRGTDDDDDDSGSTPLRVRVDSTLARSDDTACSKVSISGISPSQIGKRVYFTLIRR